jgi:hypothetical protein
MPDEKQVLDDRKNKKYQRQDNLLVIGLEDHA